MSTKDLDARVAYRWWAELNGIETDTLADRGALARLRRATTPAAAWSEPALRRLYRMFKLPEAGGAERLEQAMERVALIAIVLAHVREAEPQTAFGEALGQSRPGSETALLSPLRARRLVAARDFDEALRGFREAVSLLGGRAHIRSLTEAVGNWLDPDDGDRTRTRFLFAYHGAANAAPDLHEPTASDDKDPTP